MNSRTDRARIWQKNYFNGDNLRSSTTNIPELLSLIKPDTIFEVGCGQSHLWELPYQYTGADICGDLVDDNRRLYPDVDFQRFDALTEPIPTVDVVICKDLCEFLPSNEVIRLLDNIYKSGSKWLIATTDPRVESRVETTENVYRHINLQTYGAKLVLLTHNDIGLFELRVNERS